MISLLEFACCWNPDEQDDKRDFLEENSRRIGGECLDAQVWQVIDGQGRLSGDATRPSVHFGAGDGYRFAAGERRLIIAETRMRILIAPLE